MIYDTLSKGEDGLYHSRALNDDNKRYFVQLDGVTVSDVDQETGEVSFEVTGKTTRPRSNLFTLSIFSLHLKIVRRGSAKNFQRRRFRVHIPEVKISKLIVFPQHVFSITRRKVLNLVQSQWVCHVQHSWNFLDFGSRRKRLVHLGILSN